MLFNVLATFISALSVIVAAVTFIINFRRTKKVETLQAIDEIFESYYQLSKKDVNSHYFEYVKYMSKVERFAAAVNAGIYDEKLVHNRTSIMFRKQYNDFMKDIIQQRRKQFNREDYYSEIVKMIQVN